MALADNLNFTKAAKTCNVSQPALTKAIQALEDEVGAKLIIREGKHSHLTTIGKLLRLELTKVEAGIEEAVNVVKRDLTLEQSQLNVAVMTSFGPSRFIKLLSEYKRSFPGVKLVLRDIKQSDAFNALLDGQFDCIFYADNGLIVHDKLDAIELATEKFVVAFGPGHPFRYADEVDALQVAAEPYIERLHCEARPHFLQFLEDNNVELQLVYCSEREDWIQALIANGNGVCLLPEHTICRDDIMHRPVVNPVIKRQLQLLTVKNRSANAALTSFLTFAHGWYDLNTSIG